MEECKIKSHYFTIYDQEIIEKILLLKISYLRFNVELEQEDSACICVYRPDNSMLETLGRKWSKININKSVKIRTPQCLIPYVGKRIKYYIDRISLNKNELFKIKPLDFSLPIKIHTKKISELQVPYFTLSGRCVIPKSYLNKHLDKKINNITLSFGLVNNLVVEEGFLYAYIAPKANSSKFIFSLEKMPNGVRTHPVKGVIDFLSCRQKLIINYKYIGTLKSEEYDYEIIIFEEQ